MNLNQKKMKDFASLLLLMLFISCGSQNTDNANIVASNPYLIGKWTGEGNFLDVNLNREVGLVKIEVEIKKDYTIHGKIGEAELIKTSITAAKYGFEIKGILNSKLKKKIDLDKDHLIILLVLPDKNRADASKSDANFHLKSNYTFDFSMRVGGVILTKER